MKNIILIAAAWIMALSSCTKEATAPALEETNSNTISMSNGESAEEIKATIEWTASPEVDGLGWVLSLPKDQVEVPLNLSEDYKKHGMEVIVSFKRTNQRVPCRCAEPKYYVEITSIRVANP
ncbi:hypothetical protein [Aridibaculum aurantiacum]|uniref:hypothetical protein n=1 Tax=Aridibaculum aurantiacum TaxID=2810307 RepID=UPI001A956447|nr:hypothetical protein [Aridibaculum aurantiacum]